LNPQFWYFWIGLLLIAVVMFFPDGILGGVETLARRVEANSWAKTLAKSWAKLWTKP
jgi:branched-chain amino acid transport system permease protein